MRSSMTPSIPGRLPCSRGRKSFISDSLFHKLAPNHGPFSYSSQFERHHRPEWVFLEVSHMPLGPNLILNRHVSGLNAKGGSSSFSSLLLCELKLRRWCVARVDSLMGFWRLKEAAVELHLGVSKSTCAP